MALKKFGCLDISNFVTTKVDDEFIEYQSHGRSYQLISVITSETEQQRGVSDFESLKLFQFLNLSKYKSSRLQKTKKLYQGSYIYTWQPQSGSKKANFFVNIAIKCYNSTIANLNWEVSKSFEHDTHQNLDARIF